MPPKRVLYQSHTSATTKTKAGLGEHICHFNTEMQNAKELERKIVNENRLLKEENKMIQDKLKTFCSNLERRNVASITNSLINCCSGSGISSQELNSIQRLNGLFRYIEKLQELINLQDIEIATKKQEHEFLYRENRKLIDAFDKDTNFKQESAEKSSVVRTFLKYLSDSGSFANENCQRLIKKITSYICNLENDNKIIKEKQFEEIQNLKYSMTQKHKQIIMTVTEKDNEIQRLKETLQCVTQVAQSRMHALETDRKKMENALELYSKRYSAQNLNNPDISNETVTFTSSSFKVAERNFTTAVDKMFQIIEKCCQMKSLEEVSERADIINTEENLKLIYQIQEELQLYDEQINKFQGTRESKLFLHIQEMLLRVVQKLDVIESQKKKEVIDERRKIIIRVKHLQNMLEERLY